MFPLLIVFRAFATLYDSANCTILVLTTVACSTVHKTCIGGRRILVGAWKPELVQQVHKLVAPADRLSFARFGSFVLRTQAENTTTKQQQH
jgi:hypothetical protein